MELAHEGGARAGNGGRGGELEIAPAGRPSVHVSMAFQLPVARAISVFGASIVNEELTAAVRPPSVAVRV